MSQDANANSIESLGSPEIFDSICTLLTSKNISFKQVEHEPTKTSEESAKARGEDLSIGGKAILMKTDDSFNLFVFSAAKKLSSKKVKKFLGLKKIRFAERNELYDMTKLVPGCVPPFGKPVLPFDIYLDESMKQNDKIAFNAGMLTKSIVLAMDDYLAAASPILFEFTE